MKWKDWEFLGKVTVMSYTHKLRKLLEKVGCGMSLVGGTWDFAKKKGGRI